jgi:Rrf2 family nitric oxide-sensitive transcriptional repressor
MLSQTVEYALRAMVMLAERYGHPRVTREIAATARIPSAYLSKVMQGLVRAGLVNSQRGLHGGFTLTREPSQISVWDVVQAVEPLERITVCPLGLPSHGTQLCPLHRRLDQAIAEVQQSFQQTILSELLEDERGRRPLCDVSRIAPRPKRSGTGRGGSPNGKTP